jgi:hypothetical protein
MLVWDPHMAPVMMSEQPRQLCLVEGSSRNSCVGAQVSEAAQSCEALPHTDSHPIHKHRVLLCAQRGGRCHHLLLVHSGGHLVSHSPLVSKRCCRESSHAICLIRHAALLPFASCTRNFHACLFLPGHAGTRFFLDSWSTPTTKIHGWMRMVRVCDGGCVRWGVPNSGSKCAERGWKWHSRNKCAVCGSQGSRSDEAIRQSWTLPF